MQCALTHFVLLSDAKKIGIEINTRINSFMPYLIGTISLILLAVAFSFFYLPLALVFIAISFYFAAFLLLDLVLSKKLSIYLILGFSVFMMIIVFALFYKMLSEPFGIILIVIFPLSISLVSFVKNYLLKYPSNI